MLPADADALLGLAERLAREAGEHIRAGRARGITAVSTKTTATDMVTEFDRAAEALIVGVLRDERPGDAIIGEEGTDRPGSTGVTWFIDPIDGTTNFLYGLPGYAVSVAASDEDGPVAGAVAVPAFGEVFTARRGGGAHCNGQAIHASAQDRLGDTLVATGFNYDAATRQRQAAVVERLIGQVRDIRRFGAAAVDLCFVAGGRVDAFFEKGLNPWDTAAGALIATEAGARLGDLEGGPPRPGQLLVAAPGVFDALRDLLVSAGAAAA